jgi:hypothetical protein
MSLAKVGAFEVLGVGAAVAGIPEIPIQTSSAKAPRAEVRIILSLIPISIIVVSLISAATVSQLLTVAR